VVERSCSSITRHQDLAAASLATKKRIDAAADVGLLRRGRHLGFVPATAAVGWEVVSVLPFLFDCPAGGRPLI